MASSGYDTEIKLQLLNMLNDICINLLSDDDFCVVNPADQYFELLCIAILTSFMLYILCKRIHILKSGLLYLLFQLQIHLNNFAAKKAWG